MLIKLGSILCDQNRSLLALLLLTSAVSLDQNVMAQESGSKVCAKFSLKEDFKVNAAIKIVNSGASCPKGFFTFFNTAELELLKGDTGPAGATGATGAAGATGAQGPAGADGSVDYASCVAANVTTTTPNTPYVSSLNCDFEFDGVNNDDACIQSYSVSSTNTYDIHQVVPTVVSGCFESISVTTRNTNGSAVRDITLYATCCPR